MLVKLIVLVLPLGLDSFAVAAALGVTGISPRRRLRISLLMAGFEALMPLVGLAIGLPLGRTIGSDADYVAIALLIGFGLYSLHSEAGESEDVDRFAAASGWRAVALGLSVSLDELGIGLTFGFLRVPVGIAIALIGAQALVLTQLGMRLGSRLSARLTQAAGWVAGGALIALGVGLAIEKVLAG